MPDATPFPIDALPDWLRDFVTTVAESKQVPVALPALFALGTIASTVATKAKVEIRAGYQEPLNLWTATVLGSGERKSPTLADVIRPLEAVETALVEAWHSLPVSDSDDDSPPVPLLTRFERLDRDYDDSPTPAAFPPFREAVRRIAGLCDRVAPHVEPRLLVDDVTSARFAEMLYEQGGRLAILNPEGAFFDNTLRFARAGTADIDELLRAFSGDSLRRDRVRGRTERRGFIVREPAVSIAISPQPQVLRSLRRHPALRGRGLLARFLWAVPASSVGARVIDAPTLRADAVVTYAAHIRAMLSLGWREPVQPRQPRAHILTLSDGARRERDQFAQKIEDRLGEEGDLRTLSDFANKLPGLVARLSGVIHLSLHARRGEEAFGLEISPETMAAAATIGDFALPHAFAAHALIDGGADADDEVEYVLHRMRERCAESYSARQVYRLVEGRLGRMTRVEAALEILVERGTLEVAPSTESTGGRPRGPVYTWSKKTGGDGSK